MTNDQATAAADEAQAAATHLSRKVTRGISWSVGGTLFSKFAGLGLGLVLARLLAPADFGVFAVALAATQVVMMIKDLGIEAAVQHWRGPLDEMIPTAKTISLAFSALVYAIFWACAPAFATLAGNPEAKSVIRLLTAVVLIYGFNAVPSGVLMREFRQGVLVAANFVGLVFNAAIAIGLAVAGAGAMSFAAGQVAGTAVAGGIIFVSAGVSFRLGLNPEIGKRLLRFGVPMAGGMALEAILLNVDFVVIGRMLDAQNLGYYLLAFNVSGWALTSITASIRYVAVAGFSRLSEMESARLNEGTQRSISTLYLVVVPIGALTAALAAPLISVMYGDGWDPAAGVLRFLAVLTIVRVLISLAHDFFVGLGSTKSTLLINGLWAAALIPAMIIGVSTAGIRGAGIAHAVVGLGVAIPITVIALHRVGIRLRPVLPSLVRPTCGSVIAALVAILVNTSWSAPDLVRLLGAGTIGLLVYVVVSFRPRDIRMVLDSGRARIFPGPKHGRGALKPTRPAEAR